METIQYKPKTTPLHTICPQKLSENSKNFYLTKKSSSIFVQNKNQKNKIPFQINKNKFQSKTFFEKAEKSALQKIKLLKIRKRNIFEPKIRKINSEYFNPMKKIRASSQDNDRIALAHNKFINLFSGRIENEIKTDKNITKELDAEIENLNVKEFMEKIKKDFNDIGNLIKIKFVVDEKRKYEYEKNEFVILKIIENDLKENQGLDIKEFILNEQKLNMYKSLKDNNVQNNSVIKVIV